MTIDVDAPHDEPTSASDARGRPSPARAAAREGLEDYTLRFAPRSYRTWGAGAVATSALGGIAYLADFSIGANAALTHGTANALLGILVAAVVIFVTGLPLAWYAARYNLDLDLVTRGSGFGYHGSIVTNVVFASFTVIFFALEGAIMAQGLEVALHVPRPVGYAVSTLVVVPLVAYGMKALSTLQIWTTPLWLVLMVVPLAYLVVVDPSSVSTFLTYETDAGRGVDPAAVMLAAGVCLSLIAQIAEQIDYLRFMPPRTAANRQAWWRAVVVGGPGWVVFGATKQVVGAFIAVWLVARADPAASTTAVEPVHQFLGVYELMVPGWLALTLGVVLVVVSQLKINVTNAYSGSLAWTNAFTRVTRRYPGRLVFVVVNLAIALALMEADLFDVLSTVLAFYANCGIAWIVTVAVDIVVNKHLLRLSPVHPEFRRGMLYAWNPVGLVSLLLAAGVSIAVFFGALGPGPAPFSALFAVAIPVVVTPATAIATRGRFYLRRTDDGIDLPMHDEDGNPSGVLLRCHVTGLEFERPDMLLSAERAPDGSPQYVSSLALATDRTGRLVLPEQR